MLGHLLELRRRAWWVVIIFFAWLLLFFFWASDLLSMLLAPIKRVLPAQDTLIVTSITAPFTVPLKVATDAALMMTIPFVLFQVWRFAFPGLYIHERRSMGFVCLASVGLFALGAIFCFYGVLPFMLQFFAQAVPYGVKYTPDILSALGFIIRMIIVFGIFFQLPLLCIVLVRLQWIKVEALKKIRPYVIVGAFTIGMLLTPPDVLSQVMLALPLCLLYELGILVAGFLTKREKARVYRK